MFQHFRYTEANNARANCNSIFQFASNFQKCTEEPVKKSGPARQFTPVPSLLLDPLSIFGDSPFSMFGNMHQELSRAFGQPGRTNQLTQGDDFSTLVWAPPSELAFRDGNLVVSAELPGLTEQDVTIEVNDEHLDHPGERSVRAGRSGGGIRRTERRYGQFLPGDRIARRSGG